MPWHPSDAEHPPAVSTSPTPPVCAQRSAPPTNKPLIAPPNSLSASREPVPPFPFIRLLPSVPFTFFGGRSQPRMLTPGHPPRPNLRTGQRVWHASSTRHCTRGP
ncbi:hypothetical protein EJ06DRAFT_128867 [Trichodelitschia bisporula]|uniref:Uncharacterized protein n=1 Tax=Trichodelitschia bisporula TaxID=703511 RepID=A0A6G1HP57_9PEZI|nr:hypothetical protein EJ06DRAFT_128867 [Trichodelitschia bisporula]